MFTDYKLRQFVIVLFLLLSSIAVTQAQQLPNNAIHILVPEKITENQVLPLNVIANITTPSYGFSFEVEYDHTLLQPRITDNTIAQLGDLFPEAQMIINQSKQLTDTLSVIEIAYTQMAPKPEITGEGVLASVYFDILQEGETQIHVEKTQIAEIVDGVAQYIPIQVSDPTVYIGINKPPITGRGPENGVDIPLILVAISIIILAIVGLAGVTLTYKNRKNRRKRSFSYGL